MTKDRTKIFFKIIIIYLNKLCKKTTMNSKKISLGLALISLSISLPFQVDNKSIAQENAGYTKLEEIVENYQDLMGKTVSVRGETEDVETGSTFILSSEEGLKSIFGEDEVLIINVNNQPSILPKQDADVQVTGKVTQFVLQEMQTQYGLDLDPKLYTEYELKPVILAQSIALAPEPGEVTKEPQAFYDKKVAIKGDVKNVVGVSVFTLDEDQIIGGSDLVVVNLSGEPLPTEDEEVIITGFIRPFVKEDLERYYNLYWSSEVQEKIDTGYSNIPVLVADTISTVTE